MSSEIRSARRSLDDMKIQLESRKRKLERKKRARDDMRRNERELKKAGLMSGWGDSPELRRMEQDISSYESEIKDYSNHITQRNNDIASLEQQKKNLRSNRAVIEAEQ